MDASNRIMRELLGRALMPILAEVDAESGKSNWERWLEVLQAKADAGDAKTAELLARSRELKFGGDISPETSA